jgi:hypothetical protein
MFIIVHKKKSLSLGEFNWLQTISATLLYNRGSVYLFPSSIVAPIQYKQIACVTATICHPLKDTLSDKA